MASHAGESAHIDDNGGDAVGNVTREITRAMIRLYKERFGRGPECVYTHYAGPDTIVSILTNSLTPVEKSLRDMGEQQRLRDIRLIFQHATEPQFRQAVEQITGRRVIGFMSAIDVEHDLSSEVFTLEPRVLPETASRRVVVSDDPI